MCSLASGLQVGLTACYHELLLSALIKTSMQKMSDTSGGMNEKLKTGPNILVDSFIEIHPYFLGKKGEKKLQGSQF